MVEGGGFGGIELFTEAGRGERTIEAKLAELWEFLPMVYERLEIPVTLSSPGRKELGNRGYRGPRLLERGDVIPRVALALVDISRARRDGLLGERPGARLQVELVGG